jgi:hypothetical protein
MRLSGDRAGNKVPLLPPSRTSSIGQHDYTSTLLPYLIPAPLTSISPSSYFFYFIFTLDSLDCGLTLQRIGSMSSEVECSVAC